MCCRLLRSVFLDNRERESGRTPKHQAWIPRRVVPGMGRVDGNQTGLPVMRPWVHARCRRCCFVGIISRVESLPSRARASGGRLPEFPVSPWAFTLWSCFARFQIPGLHEFRRTEKPVFRLRGSVEDLPGIAQLAGVRREQTILQKIGKRRGCIYRKLEPVGVFVRIPPGDFDVSRFQLSR